MWASSTVGAVYTDRTTPGQAFNLVVGADGYPSGYDEGGRAWHGSIAEILAYETVLAADEREQIGSYLKTKYGVDADYPDAAPAGSLVADAYLTVTEDATILPDTPGSATISGLAVANDATAQLGAGPSDYILGTVGGQGTIEGDFSLTGVFSPGGWGMVGTLNVDDVVMEDGCGYEWGLSETGIATAAELAAEDSPSTSM